MPTIAKVIFAWPPIKNVKGYPTCGQNRQFQIFKDPTFIYPIVPATCATMLAQNGHPTLWVDAIAEELDDREFGMSILQLRPDYMVLECPTPLINRYKEYTLGLKQHCPDIKLIITGDHATAFPEKVKEELQADYVVPGGDWHYKVYEIIRGSPWDKAKLPPHIDRNITRSWLYAYKNGNFKYLPATYIMSAMDCWHRKCTFCSWAQYHKNYYARPVDDVLQEIEELICAGFKEIFDDSGTFPVGDWLRDFCNGMIERGYNDYIAFDCNMRFGSVSTEVFELMAKAGFRMVLWGIESANQKTLTRLNKGFTIEDIKIDLLTAKKAGLTNHITAMFGYYWESYEEARRTYDLVRWLLRKGLAFSAQATICIPYPITPLWQECKDAGMILTEEWDRYDMSEPIMKIPYSKEKLFALQSGIYNMAFHPEFIARRLAEVRNIDDLRYYLRIGRKIYDRFGNWHEVAKPAKAGSTG